MGGMDKLCAKNRASGNALIVKTGGRIERQSDDVLRLPACGTS